MAYVDTDKLLNSLPDDLPYKASVKRVLIQAPDEDVVAVVRCKDCKNSLKGEREHYDCWLTRTKMEPMDFCSYGERKE